MTTRLSAPSVADSVDSPLEALVVARLSTVKYWVLGRVSTLTGSPAFAPGLTRMSRRLLLTMIEVTTPSLVVYGFQSLSFTSTSPLIDVIPAALTSLASLSSPANGSAATGFTVGTAYA